MISNGDTEVNSLLPFVIFALTSIDQLTAIL